MFDDVPGHIPPSLIALAFLGSEKPINTQESGHKMKRYPNSTWYIFLNIINLGWVEIILMARRRIRGIEINQFGCSLP